MRKFSVRSILSLVLSFAFFLNPLASTTAASSFISVTAPAEVQLGQTFEIAVEVAAAADTSYYLKARLGPEDTSALNKGRTLDPDTDVWLSDTVSWDRFPKFQTNGDGVWSGKLRVSFSPTASAGPYLLVVRAKKADTDSFVNSSPYKITLVEAQTPPIIQTPKVETLGTPILNEFLASPASGTEWVEIKNKGFGIADLSGWKLDDETGKSTPYEFPPSTFINPGEFLVVNFGSPKLNDNADQVRLLKPDDTVVETYSYEKPEKGKSFAKDSSGSWFIAEPTPGAENPNPPRVAGSINETTTNQVNSTSDSPTEISTSDPTRLPILSVSTKSATVAAVASENLTSKNALLNLLLGGLGIILVFSAVLIVFKEPLLKLFKKLRPVNQALPQG